MKIVGLIAEYNPFHNGHQYHIEKAKEITGADAVIVVMSGDFVQRGMPSIMPKHLRAKVALASGASVVLELPVCYATGSAEYFAYGAVSLLDKLGCVDSVCFGSECGDIHILQKLAKIISNEPEEYKLFLNQYLKEGNAFPLARQKALHEYWKNDVSKNEDLEKILSKPNNILGIEYLKALLRLNSKMKAYTITRISSHYHDDELQEKYSSASAIRKVLRTDDSPKIDEPFFDNKQAQLHERNNTINFKHLHGQLPNAALDIMESCFQKRFPIFANDFSLLLKYKLLRETKTSLQTYADVSEELANRIINQLNTYKNFDQFCELLKTKEVTYSRISRALIHILLGIKKEDYADIEYARILGFCKEDDSVLSLIKECASITLISKLSASYDLSAHAYQMLEQDIFAANLYESVVTDKFGTVFIHEYSQAMIIAKK